jgi:methyltransferase (TIGR00027 family)
MGERKRSRTAQSVTAERALLADIGVVDDLLAQTMLAPAMSAVVWVARRLPRRMWARSVTLAGLAARVLWVDGQVAAALDAGIDQVVVVGAGYDSRAWRFRREGVRFFELDHGATQQDKVRRAPPGDGPGPTYVEADLTTQLASVCVGGRGLDRLRRVLFVLEGITMYLDEVVVRRQLAGLTDAAAPGSRLVVDFQPPPAIGTAKHRRQTRLQDLARTGSGESFRCCVDRGQAVGMVRASGWTIDEVTNLRDVGQALISRSSGLQVDAVNDQKTLVAASLG